MAASALSRLWTTISPWPPAEGSTASTMTRQGPEVLLADMAVSTNSGVLIVGVLVIRALRFGSTLRPLIFRNSHIGNHGMRVHMLRAYFARVYVRMCNGQYSVRRMPKPCKATGKFKSEPPHLGGQT